LLSRPGVLIGEKLAAFFVILAQAGGAAYLQFLPILFIFAIFYFLLIAPAQRRQRRTQQMLSALKNGDRVVTSGGIRGTIVSIKEDVIQVRVPPNQVTLEFLRSAVSSVETESK
jgi:preprotein translocase subunit YajC